MSFSVAAKGSRAQISRSAFKTILLTTTAIAALTLAQTAARADGGTGGAALHASSGGFGGAGGTGFAGNAGSAGGDDAPYGGGGGGGGGAGGGTGGQGGAGDAGTNAAGGTAISPDGANGDDEVSGLGGGGGGGGYGGNHGTVASGMANTDSIIGGNGGTGGAGFTAASVRIDNFGSITGGDGGSLGVAGTGEYLVIPVDGADGAGGAGIVGSDLNIYNYDTIISGGLGGDGVTRANAITFTGGNNKITFSNSTTGLIGNIDVTGTLTFDQSANDVAVDNLITGTGAVAKTGTASVTLSGSNTYTGGTTVTGGTLAITNSNALGSGTLALENGTALTLDGTGIDLANNITVAGDPTFTVGAGNTNTISGVIADGATAGDVVKDGDGTLILLATNTYTGATTVDAGTLDVTGSIASSSLTTVNSGGTLIGTGTVGNMAVASGGTFAPGAAGIAGGSTTVSGTLTLDSGSNYLVVVDPTSASYANVSGTASLAGTAIAAFDTGSYAVKQYTILTSAGLGGTTFDSFATTDLPSGFAASLEYTSTDVLLDLTAALGAGDSLNTNQQNVASGLNVYFNNGGTMPSNFLTIFGLSGGNLATALSQLSGEGATAGVDGSFQMMNQFFGLMSGISADGASVGGTLSFAPGTPASLPAEALSYASTPGLNESAVGSWHYWGSAFGGWNRTDGNASVGSNTVKASSYGLAMGADFQYSADTVMGVALAYGRTEWDLSNSLGGGDSDAL